MANLTDVKLPSNVAVPVKIVEGGSGGGDMLKETYDTDDNGIVDRAEVADSVTWENVKNKPSTFTPKNHSHTINDITNLQTELNDKLTASQMTAQTDSTAEDVPGLLADFNSLLQKLRDAGIMQQ